MIVSQLHVFKQYCVKGLTWVKRFSDLLWFSACSWTRAGAADLRWKHESRTDWSGREVVTFSAPPHMSHEELEVACCSFSGEIPTRSTETRSRHSEWSLFPNLVCCLSRQVFRVHRHTSQVKSVPKFIFKDSFWLSMYLSQISQSQNALHQGQ